MKISDMIVMMLLVAVFAGMCCVLAAAVHIYPGFGLLVGGVFGAVLAVVYLWEESR